MGEAEDKNSQKRRGSLKNPFSKDQIKSFKSTSSIEKTNSPTLVDFKNPLMKNKTHLKVDF